MKEPITYLKKSSAYYIGNFLIISASLLLAYTYAPLIRAYTPDTLISQKIPEKGIFIQIPKINATSPIILNVDPWNQKEYQNALQFGVAHAKDTGVPGEEEGSFLFAHSTDAPWRLTRYNTIFLRLNELTLGDEILIFKDEKKFTYKVTDKKEIWPTETKYLKNIPDSILILQTCTPIGTDFKRLLIFAEKFTE